MPVLLHAIDQRHGLALPQMELAQRHVVVGPVHVLHQIVPQHRHGLARLLAGEAAVLLEADALADEEVVAVVDAELQDAELLQLAQIEVAGGIGQAVLPLEIDEGLVAPEDVGEKGIEPRLLVKRLILLLGKDGPAALGILGPVQQLFEGESHQMADLQQGVERQGGLVHHALHGGDGNPHGFCQGLIADPLVGQGFLQGVEDVIGQCLAVGHATIPLSAFLVVSGIEWFVCIGLKF